MMLQGNRSLVALYLFLCPVIVQWSSARWLGDQIDTENVTI